jgi:hypothetical protein
VASKSKSAPSSEVKVAQSDAEPALMLAIVPPMSSNGADLSPAYLPNSRHIKPGLLQRWKSRLTVQ